MFKFEKKDLLNLTNKSCEEMYKSVLTLGSNTPTYGVFITVSLPPYLLMGTIRNGIIKGIKYADLKKEMQLDVCIRYFENVFMPSFYKPIIIMTYEYDSSGKVHLHAIVWDENIKNAYDLMELQSDIRLNITVQKIMKKCNMKRDYCNSIVELEDAKKTISYMDKDYKMKKYSSYFKGINLIDTNA